jgi:hypothetical protein
LFAAEFGPCPGNEGIVERRGFHAENR